MSVKPFFKWRSLLLIFSVCLNFVLIGYLVSKYLNRAEKNASVLLIGDSLTENGKWHKLLHRKDIKTISAGGLTSAHIYLILNGQIETMEVERAFLQCGINDILAGVPRRNTMSNIQRIQTILKKRDVNLTITLLTHTLQDSIMNVGYKGLNDSIAALNDSILNLCKTEEITILDLNSKVSANNRILMEYTTDGVHYTERTYEIWSQLINMDLKQSQY